MTSLENILKLWGLFVLPAYMLSYIVFLHFKRFSYFQSYLLRFNYKILLFTLSILVAYIISLNSSFFYKYDEKLSQKYLNPYEAIKLPFDQLKISSDNSIGETELRLKNNHSINGENFLIILDKTKSTSISPQLEKKTDRLKKNILDYVINNNNINAPSNFTVPDYNDSILSKLEIRDLTVAYFLRALYNLSYDHKDTAHYSILLYYGDNLFTPVLGNTSDISIKNALDSFCKTAYKQVEGSHNTNFQDVLSKLDAHIKSDNKSSYKKNTNVVIISDFEHEANKVNVSFRMLESELGNKPYTKEIKLSLFHLDNDHPNTNNAERTIRLFNNFFINSRNYYYDEIDVLTATDSYLDVLRTIFSYNRPEAKDNITNLNFYYPYGVKNKKRISTSKLCCKIVDNVDASQLVFNFNNQNQIRNSSRMTINNQYVLDQNRCVAVDNCESLMLEIASFGSIDNDNYLEVTNPKQMFTTSIPINIFEKLPHSSVIVMCVCYLLMMSLLLINAFIYLKASISCLSETIKGKEANKHQRKSVNKLELYIFSLMIIFIALFFLVMLFISYITVLTHEPLVGIITLILTSIYIYVNSKPSRSEHYRAAEPKKHLAIDEGAQGT